MHQLLRASIVVASFVSAVAPASAQQLSFWFDYPGTPLSVTDLGPIAGVVSPYGGLMFRANDPNTLLIAEASDYLVSRILATPVMRDAQGHIVSFGPLTVVSTSPGLVNGGLDGAMDEGPNGVIFYVTFPDNTLGEVKPGSTTPDKLIDLTAVGIAPSTGGIVFIPPGVPHAGEMRIVSWTTGKWYHANFTRDGSGTYDVTAGAQTVILGAQPESMRYLPPGTSTIDTVLGYTPPNGWLLISKYVGGRVDVYEVDDQGDPVIFTETPLIDGMDCAQGMALDPVTGDLLVSSFGCPDRIVRLSGLAAKQPCPADLNGDGAVDAADLAVLLGSWGGTRAGDINADGIVDAADLAVLLGAWGPC